MDTQQLAAEFARLVKANEARAILRFVADEGAALTAALTEWAQQRRTNMSSKPTIAELEAILASPPGTFRTEISPSGEISAVRCAVDVSDIRRRALEEAEQRCRARAASIRTRVDYHASPTLMARASEADECAEAIARLKEPHD